MSIADRIEVLSNLDALEFVKSIPDEIWFLITDVIADDPYFDSDNPEHYERFNGRTARYQKGKLFMKNADTRLMDSKHRAKIYDHIKSKISSHTRMIYFHSDLSMLPKLETDYCDHVWVKKIKDASAGNNDRKNGEFIRISHRPQGMIVGRILNQFIFLPAPNNKNGHLVRSCAKPIKLFKEFYRHLDSTFILDPFAGWGGSIFAAREMGISIYANDIDSSVNWIQKKNTMKEYWEPYIEVDEDCMQLGHIQGVEALSSTTAQCQRCNEIIPMEENT